MVQIFPLDFEGVWCELLEQPSPHRPALFLDRDGVIIEDTLYLHRAEDIVLIDGAAKVIAAANARSVPVIVVTNQSGIGRGLYGWAEFFAVQTALLEMLTNEGARVSAVFAVPHHHEGKGDYVHPDHPARKPNAGMLLRARDAFSLDLAQSWIVGDHVTDIEAAQRAGLAGGIHVLTGHGIEERRKLGAFLAKPSFELRKANSIAAALDLPLLRQG